MLMKETTWGNLRRKTGVRLAVIALASTGFALSSQAITNTLTSGNSVVQINPNSQQGMFSWTVGGANQLAQQWFWLGVGSGAPTAINNISAAGISGVTANTLTTTYGNTSYNVGITYLLTGGVNGGGPGAVQSDMSESIIINNTSAAPITFQFYEYANFTIEGVGNPNNVSLTQAGGGYSLAFQTAGALGLNETIVAPPATYGEVGPVGVPNSTLSKLNNGVNPVTLNGTSGAGPGNEAWAMQWPLTIAPNSSALISKDLLLEITPVPEPSVLALIGLGAGALAVQLRRKRA
jgi:PEP-CTERM motif